jgi:hypothetical protein
MYNRSKRRLRSRRKLFGGTKKSKCRRRSKRRSREWTDNLHKIESHREVLILEQLLRDMLNESPPRRPRPTSQLKPRRREVEQIGKYNAIRTQFDNDIRVRKLLFEQPLVENLVNDHIIDLTDYHGLSDDTSSLEVMSINQIVAG